MYNISWFLVFSLPNDLRTVYIIYGKIRKSYLLIVAAAYCAVGEDRVNQFRMNGDKLC